MKKLLRVTVLFAATAGLIAFRGIGTSVSAASLGPQAVGPSAKVDQQASKPAADGVKVYGSNCAVCHGKQREGNLPAIPPLRGLKERLTEAQIVDTIHNGKPGKMPAFAQVQGEELTALVHYLSSDDVAAQTAGSAAKPESLHASADAGGRLFQQNCAFCHGRDAAGGETGPDLTRSKLVIADKGGDQISDVIRNGRIDKKMPAFSFSDQDLLSVVDFIHQAQVKMSSKPGGRRGVDIADLQTGDVEAGKRYFNGAGTCATCHSPTGDLAGVASRHEGLQLEERMLYPKDVKSRVTVTLSSGERVAGTVAYLDEFTIGLRDSEGTYRSWPIAAVKYAIDAPVQAHVALFSKYTDADIHNLMAYIQTLR